VVPPGLSTLPAQAGPAAKIIAVSADAPSGGPNPYIGRSAAMASRPCGEQFWVVSRHRDQPASRSYLRSSATQFGRAWVRVSASAPGIPTCSLESSISEVPGPLSRPRARRRPRRTARAGPRSARRARAGARTSLRWPGAAAGGRVEHVECEQRRATLVARGRVTCVTGRPSTSARTWSHSDWSLLTRPAAATSTTRGAAGCRSSATRA